MFLFKDFLDCVVCLCLVEYFVVFCQCDFDWYVLFVFLFGLFDVELFVVGFGLGEKGVNCIGCLFIGDVVGELFYLVLYCFGFVSVVELLGQDNWVNFVMQLLNCCIINVVCCLLFVNKLMMDEIW